MPDVTNLIPIPCKIITTNKTSISIYRCPSLPSGTCQTVCLSFLWCHFLISSFVHFVFVSPFTVPLKMDFGQTWWTANMATWMQLASLYDHQEILVWSKHQLDLVGNAFLLSNMVFERITFLFCFRGKCLFIWIWHLSAPQHWSSGHLKIVIWQSM